ncbi:MAG: 2,3-bisphosphoglycerate-independent phosphoglycerate mutase [Candidatus Bathyarchaeota archaeon]|nr:2,3-bisphosphoglycerate-independent phosphoglycerate mutase [Candidatus Bathyarchaeota archaeon]
MVQRRVILVVRDGWGYTSETAGNAVHLAWTPNDDYYMKNYPWTLLKCTGNAVGLPEGTQGGSEPGHLTMGAGRIVWQPLEEINKSIRDGSFYKVKPFLDAIKYCKQTGGKLHLAGLFSDQGIHGTIHHLNALLELTRRERFGRVFIHCFLDGRDVPEYSADQFFNETQRIIEEKGIGRFASIVGRYYAMDRDTNWDRTERAYSLLTIGKGRRNNDPIEAIYRAYKRDPELSDYYVEPIILVDSKGEPVATVDDGDAFIFWNFRSDRARQITYAFTLKEFTKFHRTKTPRIYFVCMSVYDQKLPLPVAFLQKTVTNNLGNVLSSFRLRQLRIAETEKYAHVTFFFNSQVEEPNFGEERILVPSLKIPSYEDQPEMSALGITDRVVSEIERNFYDLILVNYANGDLVGHSANLQAGITACEVVDDCLGRVVNAGLQEDYVVLVTGDHGNIENMFYTDGSPNPSHGLNPVPFILIGNERQLITTRLMEGMGLSSVAPTILELMGLEKPPEMTSPSLIRRFEDFIG